MTSGKDWYQTAVRVQLLILWLLLVVLLLWLTNKTEEERKAAIATREAMVQVKADSKRTNEMLKKRMKDTEFLRSVDK